MQELAITAPGAGPRADPGPGLRRDERVRTARSVEAPAARTLRDVAVVDVGSNSVRLVVYRVDGRAIWTTYNEKVLAGLGRGLGRTGRLSPEGVEEALAALRRFRAVIGPADPAQGGLEVLAAATAAVRDAGDGPAFVARVREETGLNLRVLSGEEEARFSALGVAAGQTDADGVVGDLGGSSLEFVRLAGETPGAGVTLPLGPLALGGKGGRFEPAALRREIARRLEPAAAAYRTERFYAVGGAWRNLALLHMVRTGYPLHVVQQFEMTAEEAVETAGALVRQPRLVQELLPGVSKKRAETLPHAALVLEGVVERLGVRRVALSAYGLREGLIFDRMDAQARAADPLLEGCASLGGRQGLSPELGEALARWLEPMWTARPGVFGRARGVVLMQAACRLADLGAALHPDHRGPLVFEQVLRAPVAGWTHAERAYLAQAVCSRYGVAWAPEPELLLRVLGPDALSEARALGAALRLGCDLCGRSAPVLAGTRLALQDGRLELSAEAARQGLLLGEQIRKRLATLGEVMGVEGRISA